MEVVVVQDFHLNENYNSTLTAAPPSPKPFGNTSDYHHHYFYSSAPASPTRSVAAALPGESDFAFSFAPSTAVVAADELFEGGKIKPLKREVASQGERGRRSLSSISPSSFRSSRRESRSLSPMRGGGGGGRGAGEGEGEGEGEGVGEGERGGGGGGEKRSGSKKWKLKDLFLFRSASEGSKDYLRKYIFPTSNVKSISYGDEDGGGSRSMRRMHEMHYAAASRTASEEMKKKTPLPFHRHSLFGYLRYNPAINSISRRFNRGS